MIIYEYGMRKIGTYIVYFVTKVTKDDHMISRQWLPSCRCSRPGSSIPSESEEQKRLSQLQYLGFFIWWVSKMLISFKTYFSLHKWYLQVESDSLNPDLILMLDHGCIHMFGKIWQDLRQDFGWNL